MNTYISDTNLAVGEIGAFLKGSKGVSFKPASKEAAYKGISQKLKQWRYFKKSKQKKSEIREYLQTQTGYSKSQLTRLIGQYRTHQGIRRRGYQRHCFTSRYTREDILLLVPTDEAHQTLTCGFRSRRGGKLI